MVERAEELARRAKIHNCIRGAPLDGGIVLNDEYTSPNDSDAEGRGMLMFLMMDVNEEVEKIN